MRFELFRYNTFKTEKGRKRRFVDLKITLMLHCGNEFRMEVCSFRFKFDDKVPRKGKIISSSFFGAVKYTCFGTQSLFKKVLIDTSIIPDG